MKKYLLLAVVAILAWSPAYALSKVTTIESSAVVEDPMLPPAERVIRITGPDSISYRLEASPAEVERITSIMREEPKTVISFNGEVSDVGGTRVFRLRDWRQVETTSTTTRRGPGGTVVEEKSETHYEPVH